ncbi:MAG: YfgM family protein [Desulfobacca sp.]|uniref:YfgM family protein n=1 Tax=Desulfobacca sp. TaxID=2067990 RepID=UPI00404B770A
MAQTKKVTPLKIKPEEADEFISFSARLLDFGQRHLTLIIIGLVTLLLTGAVWGYLQKRQIMRQEKAAELFQAAVSRQQGANPMLRQELQTIIQDYPETGGALQARLLLANLLFQERKYQEAAAAFEALAALTPELATLVAENLSYCYEAQKDYQRAATVLETLAAQAALPYRQELLRRQALLWEKAGDAAKALAVYQKMLQDNPPASFVPYLQEKIRLLSAAKS